MSEFRFTFESLNKTLSRIGKVAYVKREDVGKRLSFRIASNGNVSDVKRTDGTLVASISNPDTVLQRKIWDVEAISDVAMRNPRNLEVLAEGQRLEAEGDLDGAHAAYQLFKNRVTMSAEVLLPASRELESVRKGDEIKAWVTLLTAEDDGIKGDLLKLTNVAAVPVAAATGIKNFNFAELISGVKTASDLNDLLKSETAGAPAAGATVPQS